jgi:hypothetical protein
VVEEVKESRRSKLLLYGLLSSSFHILACDDDLCESAHRDHRSHMPSTTFVRTAGVLPPGKRRRVLLGELWLRTRRGRGSGRDSIDSTQGQWGVGSSAVLGITLAQSSLSLKAACELSGTASVISFL